MTMESDVKEDLKTDGAWRVEEEDEERYNFSDDKGLWQPKPEDILSMFEQLAKGGALPLQWTCPGRRAPELEQEDTKKEDTEMEVDKEDTRQEESREPEACAFDFDDTQSETGMMKTTPMRALGGPGRTPRTEKRVARMDNIMDSLRKQQIQRAAEREARRANKASPGRTPQGRGGGRLLKFGGSPMSQSPKNVGRPEVKKAAPVMAIGQSLTAGGVGQIQTSVASTSSDPVSTATSSSSSLSSTTTAATTTTSTFPSLPVQSKSTTVSSASSTNATNTAADTPSTSSTLTTTTTDSLSKTLFPSPEQQPPKSSQSGTKSPVDVHGQTNPAPLSSSFLPVISTDGQITSKPDSTTTGSIVSSQSSSEQPLNTLAGATSSTVTTTSSSTVPSSSALSSSPLPTVDSAAAMKSTEETVIITTSSNGSAVAPSSSLPTSSAAAVSTLPSIQSVTPSTNVPVSNSTLPPTVPPLSASSSSSHLTNQTPPLPSQSTTHSDNNVKTSTLSSDSGPNPLASVNPTPSGCSQPNTSINTTTTPAPMDTSAATNNSSSTVGAGSDSGVSSPSSSSAPPPSKSTTGSQPGNDPQKAADADTNMASTVSETSAVQGEKDAAKDSPSSS